MTFKVLGSTIDQRTKSTVVYCKCLVSEYLELIGEGYKDFFIQRKRENHKAYSRLKNDIKEGALLPSITLAVNTDLVDDFLGALDDDRKLESILFKPNSVNILDGLQRTFILDDIAKEGHDFSAGQEVFVECWAERDLEHLIYRMIVLNSGQKSMSMRHQIELLFVSLKNKVSEQIDGIEIFLERDLGRRTSPEKYPLGNIASAYNAFINKQTELDKSNIVSDKLNSDGGLDSKETEIIKDYNLFIEYFRHFSEIDRIAWHKYKSMSDDLSAEYEEIKRAKTETDEDKIKIDNYKVLSNAHKWFGSENTMISFFCAIASYIGTKKEERILESLEELKKMVNGGESDPFGLLRYEETKNKLNPRKVNIGYGTRKLLYKGFKEYFTESGMISMSESWLLAED
jgi:hypothetical protein